MLNETDELDDPAKVEVVLTVVLAAAEVVELTAVLVASVVVAVV